MKLSSCRARIGRVVVGCRCALTCTYSTIQSQYKNRSGPRPPFLCFFMFVFFSFFLSHFFLFSLLFLASPPTPALACVGGLCPQISVSRLPRDEASSILGPGLRLGWSEGYLGVRRDSGDKDFQGFLSGFLYLEDGVVLARSQKGRRLVLGPGNLRSMLLFFFFVLFLPLVFLSPVFPSLLIEAVVSNARGDGTSVNSYG